MHERIWNVDIFTNLRSGGTHVGRCGAKVVFTSYVVSDADGFLLLLYSFSSSSFSLSFFFFQFFSKVAFNVVWIFFIAT